MSTQSTQESSEREKAKREAMIRMAGEDVHQAVLDELERNVGTTVAGKSRRFAKGLKWDARMVGMCLRDLADRDGLEVDIEPWSDSRRPTWVVSRSDGGDWS
jgi:hypothetical protein